MIFVSQVIAGVISLGSVILTARSIGPEVFGFCTIAISLHILFMSFSDFGACSWAARELASNAISIHDYFNVMKAKAKLTSFPILLSPIAFILLPNEYAWVTSLCVYPLLWNNFNFIQQFLIAKNYFYQAAKLMIVERLFWLLIVPFSAMHLDKVLRFTLPILIGLFVHALMGNLFLRSKGYVSATHRSRGQVHIFRESRHFGLTSLFGVVNSLDGFVVAFLAGIADSASYLLSQRFRNPLMLVFNSFSVRVRSLAATKDIIKLKKTFRQEAYFLAVGCGINLLFGLTVFIYHEEIFGPEFKNLGIVMLLGALTSTWMGLMLICSTVLSGLGFEQSVSKINGFFSLILFIGVVFGAYLDGSVGAASWVSIESCIFAVITTKKMIHQLNQE